MPGALDGSSMSFLFLIARIDGLLLDELVTVVLAEPTVSVDIGSDVSGIVIQSPSSGTGTSMCSLLLLLLAVVPYISGA